MSEEELIDRWRWRDPTLRWLLDENARLAGGPDLPRKQVAKQLRRRVEELRRKNL